MKGAREKGEKVKPVHAKAPAPGAVRGPQRGKGARVKVIRDMAPRPRGGKEPVQVDEGIARERLDVGGTPAGGKGSRQLRRSDRQRGVNEDGLGELPVENIVPKRKLLRPAKDKADAIKDTGLPGDRAGGPQPLQAQVRNDDMGALPGEKQGMDAKAAAEVEEELPLQGGEEAEGQAHIRRSGQFRLAAPPSRLPGRRPQIARIEGAVPMSPVRPSLVTIS